MKKIMLTESKFYVIPRSNIKGSRVCGTPASVGMRAARAGYRGTSRHVARATSANTRSLRHQGFTLRPDSSDGRASRRRRIYTACLSHTTPPVSLIFDAHSYFHTLTYAIAYIYISLRYPHHNPIYITLTEKNK